MVSKRFAKANSPLVEDYDKSKPNSWIMYPDTNNLYRWAISQPLPTREFEWIDPDKAQEALTQDPDASKGCILEVDLDYPKELHNSHNEYPLVPERLTAEKVWMSEYQLTLLEAERTFLNSLAW